jgi:hypothetical protein
MTLNEIGIFLIRCGVGRPSGFTARCIYAVEIVGRVMSAVSGRPARAAKKLITAKTEMRMMIFTISAP